jgi:uncharacterized protein (UPF0147 family)
VKTNIDTLIKALRILAKDIQSDDGVANATIAEAADRLHELRRHTLDQALTIATLEEIVTDDNRSNKAKVLAFNYVLRKEKS